MWHTAPMHLLGMHHCRDEQEGVRALHLGELKVWTSQAPSVCLPKVDTFILRVEGAQAKGTLRWQSSLDTMLPQRQLASQNPICMWAAHHHVHYNACSEMQRLFAWLFQASEQLCRSIVMGANAELAGQITVEQ